jgi:glutathione reductase (NADPH)
MRTDKFDVVVLGGGNAGIAVTGPRRAAGMSVALIENRDLGGTCPNRGCTPKKVLVPTDMAEWLSARTYAETAAWAKIIVAYL